jgi:hypothetical protein
MGQTTGFLVMAFDNYGETIGTFSVDEYGRLMSCPYGRNVRRVLQRIFSNLLVENVNL